MKLSVLKISPFLFVSHSQTPLSSSLNSSLNAVGPYIMDKSDFLFLVSQQKELSRKHPTGLRNWKSTMTLMRPPPFGSQSNAQVRKFNRSQAKAQINNQNKIRRTASSTTPLSHAGTSSLSTTTSTTSTTTEPPVKPPLLPTTDAQGQLLEPSFSPITTYMNHLDQYDTSLGFETHPFYDPVGRRSAPAYSLSGRPREPYASIDERPDYVLERGPHGELCKE